METSDHKPLAVRMNRPLGEGVEEVRQLAEQKEKQKSRHVLLRFLVLGFAVAIVGGTSFLFWPTVQGFWATAKSIALPGSSMSLGGIMHMENSSTAVVGGKMVREGDMIGNVKVVKINQDSVEFEKSGKRWVEHMAEAKQVVGSALPMMLQLGSEQCPPCRRMKPILGELMSLHGRQFQVQYIDVRQDRSAGTKYGVNKIPTQIFYDSSGRELARHVGFYSKAEILAKWKELGVKL